MIQRIFSKLLVFALTLVSISTVFAMNNQTMESAWEAFAENDLDNATSLFQEEIGQNPTNPRPYIALSYIYQLQEHNNEAWNYFHKALQYVDNPNAHMYSAFMAQRGLLTSSTRKKQGLLTIFPDILKNPDATGVLKASVLSWSGAHEEKYGKLKKADYYFSKFHAIENWSLIGPFENISASGMEKVFPPENEFDLEKTYLGKNSTPTKWFDIYKLRRDKWVDYTHYFGNNDAVFYANTFVFSPKTQKIQIRIGVSGAVKFFLNDVEILNKIDENNTDLDTYILETTLQKGWNRLLIKNGFSEISRCNFLLRITRENGETVEALKYDISPHEYPKKHQTEVKEIRNFAELYFEDAIEKHPENIENYLLLSDCYLRNDKASDAELILRKALEIMPKSVVLKRNLMEAYLRGEKWDENETLKQEMYTLYPNFPLMLEWKFGKYMEEENIEKSEAILSKYQSLLPDSYTAMVMEMRLEFEKGNNEKAFEIIKKTYKKYPLKWEAVYLNALVSIETTRSYKKAIKFYKKFLKKARHNDAYQQLADAYWRSSNILKFEDTYNQIIENDPSATGIYYTLAKSFLQLQNFEKAEYYIKKTLALCPSCSYYHGLEGEIKQREGDKASAITSYLKALTYNPRYYEGRTKLRTLLGKESIFNHFDSFDIDSLKMNSPSAEDYPEDDAVYILSDTKRVLYKNGASELQKELLIKVLNENGIDRLKEYYIGYYSNSESIIIEKAVTIKPDGSEVNGDTKENQIVFKTLEAGDFIYIKFRKQTYNSGRLSHHLWEEINFEHNYPIENISYAILVGPNIPINFKTQYMPEQPVRKTTEEGIIYQWALKDQPSVKWEYDMPRLDDVGKMLFISTIPDWEYLVDWYLDLAKTKTRGSYEITEVINTLFDDVDSVSEIDKIIAIYTWITDNIRYSSVSFRQSGLIPQKARDVLVTKIGDCKDVATLFIAMGNEVGLSSHYVLVNTYDEGLNKNILPAIDFNHAIVGVDTEDGETIFLDLTAQNFPVHSIPRNDKEAFALEIKPGVKAPFYLDGHYFDKNTLKRTATITIDKDDVAHIQKHNLRTAALAGSFMTTYRYLGQKDRDKTLTEVLSKDYPDVKLLDFAIGEMDPKTGSLEYDYSFEAPYFLMDAGDLRLFKLPLSDKFSSNSSLSYEERQYDFVFKSPADIEEETLTIKLPKGYRPQGIKKKVSYSSPYGEYLMTMKYKNSVLTVYRKYEYKKSVIPPEDYKAFKAFYNKVVRNDEKQVVLKK